MYVGGGKGHDSPCLYIIAKKLSNANLYTIEFMVHDYDYDQVVQIWVSFGGSRVASCFVTLCWDGKLPNDCITYAIKFVCILCCNGFVNWPN